MRIKADDSLEYSHGLLTLSGREVMLDSGPDGGKRSFKRQIRDNS